MTTTSLSDIYKNLLIILSKSEMFNDALLHSKQDEAQSIIIEINYFVQSKINIVSIDSNSLTYYEKRYFDILSNLLMYPLTTIDVGDFQSIISQWQYPIIKLMYEIIGDSNRFTDI